MSNENHPNHHHDDKPTRHTHFGFETIPSAQKSARVAQVFSGVAQRYDIMNDVMSFGLHRLWKKYLILHANAKPGDAILDIAGGTGDISLAFYQQWGKKIKLLLTDINPDMLTQANTRLQNLGVLIPTQVCDAQDMELDDRSFNIVVAAFGVRNMTDKLQALKEMYRVLKPGGRVLILEFSQPHVSIRGLYDTYSMHVIPKMGACIAKDESSYRYLVESIRMHPKQEEFADLMTQAGFDDVRYVNMSLGIVALHIGIKY